MMSVMKRALYLIWQCTWGVLQSAAGACVLLLHIRNRHYCFHGAVITEWKYGSSVSLGMFIFITDDPCYPKLKNEYTKAELSEKLLVHEYGHTIQSLILGPLYLFVIGIPSILWAGLPLFIKKRNEKCISYYAFYTERWADRLGEKVTKLRSIGNLGKR